MDKYLFFKQQLIIIALIIFFCFIDSNFRKKLRLPIIPNRTKDKHRNDGSMPTSEALIFATIPYAGTFVIVDVYSYFKDGILPQNTIYSIFCFLIVPICIITYSLSLWVHKRVEEKRAINIEDSDAQEVLFLDLKMAMFVWVIFFVLPIGLMWIS